MAPATLVRALAVKPNRVVNDDMRWDKSELVDSYIAFPAKRHPINDLVLSPRIIGCRLIKDHPDYDNVDKWRIANGHHPYRARYDFIYE